MAQWRRGGISKENSAWRKRNSGICATSGIMASNAWRLAMAAAWRGICGENHPAAAKEVIISVKAWRPSAAS